MAIGPSIQASDSPLVVGESFLLGVMILAPFLMAAAAIILGVAVIDVYVLIRLVPQLRRGARWPSYLYAACLLAGLGAGVFAGMQAAQAMFQSAV